MTHNQKKNQTIETDPEVMVMMELSEKKFKIFFYRYGLRLKKTTTTIKRRKKIKQKISKIEVLKPKV